MEREQATYTVLIRERKRRIEEKQKKKASFIERAEIKKPVHLGKIDLDSLNKPKPKSESKPKEDLPKDTEPDKPVQDSSDDKPKESTNIETKYKKLSGLKTVGDKIQFRSSTFVISKIDFFGS